MKKKPCKHNFVFQSYSGHGAGGRLLKPKKIGKLKLPAVRTTALTLGFYCTRCKERVERKATPGERAFHAKWYRNPLDTAMSTGGVHKVWHEFQRKFKPVNALGNHEWDDRVPAYDLMERIEKWAKKYPKDVFCLGVDDSHFASSLLVLIEHRTENDYMGTSAVVISQCSGAPPAEFFMYPGHRDALIAALVGIRSASRPIIKRGRAHEKQRARMTSTNLRHPAVI
jgi:hypothetical protein